MASRAVSSSSFMFFLGLGTAAVLTTVYSLIPDYFPARTTTVLSYVETMLGFGWVVCF